VVIGPIPAFDPAHSSNTRFIGDVAFTRKLNLYGGFRKKMAKGGGLS
jgi:hypothetical protein